MSIDHTVPEFSKGTQNLVNPEIIDMDAAQDSVGWLTKEGKLVLAYGRNLQGNDTAAVGSVQGLGFGYRTDGVKVMYRKVGTVIQYLQNKLWTDGLLGIQGFAGLSTGLVSYYKLDANSNDSVGSNNGTDTAISYANPGIIGNCATFNGTTSKISNGVTSIPTLQSAKSISLWVNLQSINLLAGSVFGFFDTLSTTPSNSFQIITAFTTGSIQVSKWGGAIIVDSGVIPTLNTWYHIVVTTDGTTTSIYINGVLKATSTVALQSGTTLGSYAGSYPTNTNQFLNGSIDELAIFSRALSASEIAAIYKMGLNTWTTIITGLTSGADYSFSNYSSQAGAFTYATGVDGIWKIINAFPENPINMTDSTKNFGGNTLIDQGRMWLWNRKNSWTTLFASKHDLQQVGVNYTAVTGEVTGSSGTLAFNSGHATRMCFNVSITVTGTGEVFTDNWCGVLTGSLGSTGTINYATGAYVLTTGGGTGTGAYTWEDSNIGGITDFTYSATRVKGDGMFFLQDFGGDNILHVHVGQDGAYYSLKNKSSYVVTLEPTDLAPTNVLYRQDIGIISGRAAVSTNKGIAFMNTANVQKPEFTILQKSIVTNNVEPVILFPKYKFANYLYDDSVIDTWERYIIVFCKTAYATYNDTLLLCDIAAGTVDAIKYEGRCTAKDSGNLYVGSSITQTIYQLFNGFDDMGYPVSNYWIGKRDQYQMATGFVRRLRYQVGEALKKFRRLKVKGVISNSQTVQVYVDCDGDGFQLVGTILGSGAYVDYSSPQSIGSNMIGQSQIGGDDALAIAYPFFWEMKVKLTKFRARTIKFIATGIGYVHIEFTSDFDIMVFEERLPARYRQKQNVSLDGTQTNVAES